VDQKELGDPVIAENRRCGAPTTKTQRGDHSSGRSGPIVSQTMNFCKERNFLQEGEKKKKGSERSGLILIIAAATKKPLLEK